MNNLREQLESMLRYRIPQEESKYHNEASKSEGVDWVEMIIEKVVPDTLELMDKESHRFAVEKLKKLKELHYESGGGRILRVDVSDIDELITELEEQ